MIKHCDVEKSVESVGDDKALIRLSIAGFVTFTEALPDAIMFCNEEIDNRESRM